VIDTLAPLLPRATAKRNYPANPEDFKGACVRACVRAACVRAGVCVCVPTRARGQSHKAHSICHSAGVAWWLLKPKKTDITHGWSRCG
jgi:hypothetical protein